MEQNNQAIQEPAQNTPAPVEQNTGVPIIDARKYIRKKYGKILIAVITGAAVLEILLIILVVKYLKDFRLAVIPLIILSIFYAYIRQKAEDAFFQQFASTNGFSFQKNGLPGDLLGSLFFVGHSPTGRDLVEGTFQNIPFSLLNYQYTVGSGKNSHTYIYTIFRMHFVSSLPPIFLKPKHCTFGGYLFGDISSQAKEELKLEGDFDQYFDLWTKHDFQIEALQFLTPDVMAKIQDNWKDFSLEFVDDQIYIYARHMIMKDEELESMYQLVLYLIPKIIPFAEEIKGDINALNEYEKK
jgi:hypothetical protein